jgi:hypothetical protein
MTNNHWHYQLMRLKTAATGEDYYAIHEYYPMKDGDGWTETPVVVDGESVEEVKNVLIMMLEDIQKYGVKDYD